MREIGKVRQIVEESTGLEITHIYDDLIFVENSALLLRFDDKNYGNFFWYFHVDCDQENRDRFEIAFTNHARRNKMKCTFAGDFKLDSVEGKEELTVTFLEK
jgi:hypothetical protein